MLIFAIENQRFRCKDLFLGANPNNTHLQISICVIIELLHLWVGVATYGTRSHVLAISTTPIVSRAAVPVEAEPRRCFRIPKVIQVMKFLSHLSVLSCAANKLQALKLPIRNYMNTHRLLNVCAACLVYLTGMLLFRDRNRALEDSGVDVAAFICFPFVPTLTSAPNPFGRRRQCRKPFPLTLA